jgi:ABC-type xylose transport system substrate-binding protein
MENTIHQLQLIIDGYTIQLKGIHEDKWIQKPNPAKWSKKEVLGHLIDSAQNNIRRFVVAQYEKNAVIHYAQDHWVAAANYQNYVTFDLIHLWKLLNQHICTVLKNVPPGMEENLSETSEPHSIEWLAADYNKHLLHHLHQILDLEPIAYP